MDKCGAFSPTNIYLYKLALFSFPDERHTSFKKNKKKKTWTKGNKLVMCNSKIAKEKKSKLSQKAKPKTSLMFDNSNN